MDSSVRIVREVWTTSVDSRLADAPLSCALTPFLPAIAYVNSGNEGFL
jgi:hypothetical protein